MTIIASVICRTCSLQPVILFILTYILKIYKIFNKMADIFFLNH